MRLITVFFILFITAFTQAQVKLVSEIMISDSALIFDGDLQIGPDESLLYNRTDGKYDYAFNRRITTLSGNDNHATPGSAVTFAPGKFGNGAVFSHVQGSFLTTADSIFKYSYPTAYTIAFWLKVSDYSERRDILQPVEGRTLFYSNGDLSFRSSHQRNEASFSVTDDEKDEWFHVAIVLDQREGQTQHKFYVNGEPRGNNPSGYPLETEKPKSVSRMVFGAASDVVLSRNFTGMLDEIYMFDEVLSDEEIAFLMHTENLMSLAGTSLYRNISLP